PLLSPDPVARSPVRYSYLFCFRTVLCRFHPPKPHLVTVRPSPVCRTGRRAPHAARSMLLAGLRLCLTGHKNENPHTIWCMEVPYTTIRFIRCCDLSIGAPIFFSVEGEVGRTEKGTILIRANWCDVPLAQACITPLRPEPLSWSGPTIWYQHSL